jgi:hypothetical protein
MHTAQDLFTYMLTSNTGTYICLSVCSSVLFRYAPFCKHVFVPNFTEAVVGHVAITEENVGVLESGYERRRPEELPVLTRWFPSSRVVCHKAKMLDVILYHRDQVEKEREAIGEHGDDIPEGGVWGIVAVKAQDEPFELPMSPITMMRNALGVEEGGSGVPLERDVYEKSASFWETHAIVQ